MRAAPLLLWSLRAPWRSPTWWGFLGIAALGPAILARALNLSILDAGTSSTPQEWNLLAVLAGSLLGLAQLDRASWILESRSAARIPLELALFTRLRSWPSDSRSCSVPRGGDPSRPKEWGRRPGPQVRAPGDPDLDRRRSRRPAPRRRAPPRLGPAGPPERLEQSRPPSRRHPQCRELARPRGSHGRPCALDGRTPRPRSRDPRGPQGPQLP